jgi:hypothetical protein
VDVTQFDATINNRILDARRAIDEARSEGDDYLVEIRLGELESLARVAVEHGIHVEGVAETLAGYGIVTPGVGVPRLVDAPRLVDLRGAHEAPA